MHFKDYFSQQSSEYAQYRPDYPEELFKFISLQVKQKETCWDCATGNGQAAVSLAKYFDLVIATDASSAQLRKAIKIPNINYNLSTASDSLLDHHSIDLITVAQAIHWFDFTTFFSEVYRVAKHDAVIAVWGYGFQHISPTIDPIIEKLYSDILGKYWAPQRKYIEESYHTIPFPFKEIAAPAFEMKANWNLFEFAGYLQTWSSVQQYKNINKTNPLELVMDELIDTWGFAEQKRIVKWPLFLRMGKVF